MMRCWADDWNVPTVLRGEFPGLIKVLSVQVAGEDREGPDGLKDHHGWDDRSNEIIDTE